MAFYFSEYVSMSSKTFSLEFFSFVIQLAGLIDEHLDFGPTYHGSTCFKKDLPSQVPALNPHISSTGP